MTDKPSASEPLVGWMIIDDYTDDFSCWDGQISFPNPDGANLAWLDPIKMIQYSAFAKVAIERDALAKEVAELKDELDRVKLQAEILAMAVKRAETIGEIWHALEEFQKFREQRGMK